jgi:hypothetical protein
MENDMNIDTFLKKAKETKTDIEARKLLDRFQYIMGKDVALADLAIVDRESFVDHNGRVFATFDMEKNLGEHVVTISPEISNDQIFVRVVTNRSDAKAENVLHDEIVPLRHMDSHELAKEALAVAMSQHSRLLRKTGVPSAVADIMAQSRWQSDARAWAGI